MDANIELVTNDYINGQVVLDNIDNQLKSCHTFDFSVAFINQSGISLIKQNLLDLAGKNIKGRLVTSTYLGFNSPEAFGELLKFPNIEVRIFQDAGFHPKGYLFYGVEKVSCIVGSSNLTQSALKTNQEWNISFSNYHDSDIIQDITSQFERQWQNSVPLDESWLNDYKASYQAPVKPKVKLTKRSIRPNAMQQQALESLVTLRRKGQKKALLISATGTGKTYLSAFDVKAAMADRILFVVHRENIARTARESFGNVMPEKRMGIFSGSQKDDCPYLFATIQTISKPEFYKRFAPDHFDYIIIDEVHRAGARSYQGLLGYFRPQFLLGMSATPERNDGFDIYELFDHNVAYEIRLKQALEYDLICPFHYFGITDLTVDGHTFDEVSQFNLLTSPDRLDHIIKNIGLYGFFGTKVRGLVFVSRNEEARELCRLFNERGYRCVALSGSSSEKEREEAISRLELDECDNCLDYIFSVDIFNEGIDIPKVNQIVMLRPTQSAIVFVQQLGRGLRKVDDKEYVVVLDFIANYQNNYMIPLALSGDRSYNKDILRKTIITSRAFIPGCSSVSFDEISRKRIFKAIDQASFNSLSLLKREYFDLKNKLGRIPDIMDFLHYDAIDIQNIFNKCKSYHNFLVRIDEDYQVRFDKIQENMLEFVCSKLANGKRKSELLILKNLIARYGRNDGDAPAIKNLLTKNAFKVLTNDFCVSSNSIKTFEHAVFLELIDGRPDISKSFEKALATPAFANHLDQVVEYALALADEKYGNKYLNTDFKLYQKYSYEDVCRLLDWDTNVVATNIGGYKYDQKTNTFPVFINYSKDETISETIRYEDRFLNPKTLKALSKNNRSINSPDIQRIKNSASNNTMILLFVRKNKNDSQSKDFYFLGKIEPTGEFEEVLMKNTQNKAVEITYRLDTAVQDELYNYLTTSID